MRGLLPSNSMCLLRLVACATSARTCLFGCFHLSCTLFFFLSGCLSQFIVHCQHLPGSVHVYCVFYSAAIQLYMSLKRKLQPTYLQNNITMGAKQSNMSAQKQQHNPAQKRAKPRSSSTASNRTATRHSNNKPAVNPV